MKRNAFISFLLIAVFLVATTQLQAAITADLVDSTFVNVDYSVDSTATTLSQLVLITDAGAADLAVGDTLLIEPPAGFAFDTSEAVTFSSIGSGVAFGTTSIKPATFDSLYIEVTTAGNADDSVLVSGIALFPVVTTTTASNDSSTVYNLAVSSLDVTDRTANPPTGATDMDANDEIVLLPGATDDMQWAAGYAVGGPYVAGAAFGNAPVIELLDQFGNVNNDKTTKITFSPLLGGTTSAGNGVLTAGAATVGTNGGERTYSAMTYTKAEVIDIKATCSAASSDLNSYAIASASITITAGVPAHVSPVYSKSTFTVDETVTISMTVSDEYYNPCDDLETVKFSEIQGGGGTFSPTSPTAIDGDGELSVTYSPSKFYVGTVKIKLEDNGTGDFTHTKTLTVNPGALGNVGVISEDAPTLTTVTDTVGTKNPVVVELFDTYGNHIDAEAVTDVIVTKGGTDQGSWTKSLNATTGKIELDYTVGTKSGEEDTIFVETTEEGFQDFLVIDKLSGPPAVMSFVSTGDSLLTAGQLGITETLSDTVWDAYGNLSVGYKIKFATDGDGTLSAKTVTTNASGLAEPTFAADSIAGVQTVTASYGSVSATIPMTIIPNVITDVQLTVGDTAGPVTGLTAGESVKIAVKGYDAFGNLADGHGNLLNVDSDNYPDLTGILNAVFEMEDTTGAVAVGQGTLGAEADTTADGLFHYITYTTYTDDADSARIVGTLNGVSDTITVLNAASGPLAEFVIEADDEECSVDNRITFTITPKDDKGLIKHDYSSKVKLTLTDASEAGTGDDVLWDNFSDTTGFEYFTETKQNGPSFSVVLLYKKVAQGLTLTIEDTAADVSAVSDAFAFKAGITDSLHIVKPANIYAGEEYAYEIIPVDQYDNVNLDDKVRFKMTAKDPEIMPIADNMRYSNGGPVSYTLTATAGAEDQWLRFYSAQRRVATTGDPTVDWAYLNASEGQTDLFRILPADTEPPVITVDSPADGAKFADGSAIVVKGSFVDISSVDVTVNGVDATVDNEADTFAVTLDFGAFEGDTTIVVEAVDTKNPAATETINIIIDATAPVLVDLSPADSATVRSSAATISFSASDEYAGVDEASAVLTVEGDTVALTVTEGVFSYTTGTLANGWYGYTVELADEVGNVLYDTVDFEINTNLLGDVNFDKAINGDDATLVLQHASGKITLVDDTLDVADVTANGTVSALDASWILRYWAGETDLFGDGLAKTVFASGILDVEAVVATANESVVNVPLMLNDASNVYSVEYTAELNSSAAKFNDVALNLPQNWTKYSNIENGKLTVVMAGTTPLEVSALGTVSIEVVDKEAASTLTGSFVINENKNSDMRTIEIKAVPKVFKLSQNYPNPFNPTTTINFQLPASEKVVINIYDMLGNKVRTLVNRNVSAGYHSVMWNATNDNGVSMSSGTYFYHIQAGQNNSTKKMLLIK